MLLGGPRRRKEHGVTTRPVAGQARKFFGDFSWALALAGRRRNGRRIRRGRRLRLGTGPTFAATAAVASGLVAATLLAAGRGPVALRGTPAPPAAGGGLTGGAAVTRLGASRQEPAFTALEQAPPAAGVPATGGARQGERLTRRGGAARLKLAHGRDCSRTVRRRGGGTSRRHFALPPSTERTAIPQHTPLSVHAVDHLCQEPRAAGETKPKPRSTGRRMAQLALRKWLCLWLLLTDASN